MASAEDVTSTETINLVLKPLHTALDRTMLLKPGEFNSQAVAVLVECHNTVAQCTPGASDKIISVTPQATQTTPQQLSETAAYKNQLKQGQTLFAAPEESSALEIFDKIVYTHTKP